MFLAPTRYGLNVGIEFNLRRLCTRMLLCTLLVGLSYSPLVSAQDEGGATGGGSSTYVDLKPPFIVNYGGVGRLRYIKTEVALRVGGDEMASNKIRHHMPYIRHSLVMLLSRATEEEISSMEGRELLRQNALEAVREILTQEEGEHQVQDLLFSSFVVQR